MVFFGGHRMQRSFDRDVRALSEIFNFTERFSDTHGLDQSLKHKNDLIIEELFMNMVRHNKGGGPTIRIRMELEGDRVVIELVDEDVDPWDPSTAPSADLDRLVENRRSGGLGLRLVRAVAEELRYDYEDRRMTVTATRRLEH